MTSTCEAAQHRHTANSYLTSVSHLTLPSSLSRVPSLLYPPTMKLACAALLATSAAAFQTSSSAPKASVALHETKVRVKSFRLQ